MINDTIATLEKVKDVAIRATEDIVGGLNNTEAELIEIVIDQVCRDMNFEPCKIIPNFNYFVPRIATLVYRRGRIPMFKKNCFKHPNKKVKLK